jgi:ribosomal protein S18 acetylase RimI-like enzyme
MYRSYIRRALPGDLAELVRLEQLCFFSDRLSRRSLRRWLRHDDCVFLVSECDNELHGYILVARRKGTRLARLYSLAVDPRARGKGLASQLISEAERLAREDGAIYMRLEVAEDNAAAITLYRKIGYERFGFYRDYYDDHGDAIRMEKCIHTYEPALSGRVVPWIPQSTNFTCGPASLMMAMTASDQGYEPSVVEEIQIWREATTIFMTSGHGGCHPLGLALSAKKRGFNVEVWINQREPLFVEGVRSENKKRVMKLVHDAFVNEAKVQGISVHYAEVDQQILVDRFSRGDNVLVLISTYRLDRKKAPHWVVLSGFDEICLYVNDPDIDSARFSVPSAEVRHVMECQHLPIARDNFAAMSCFGASRLRTAIILSTPS